MDRKIVKKLNSAKGFTLVELIVVLALTAIILAITISGALGWIDWSRFQHENAAAEDIFFAAQNQLTELDSSGALSNKVQDALWLSSDEITQYYKTDAEEYIIGNYDSNYVLAQGYTTEGSYGIGLNQLRNSAGDLYVWSDIWNKGADNNLDREKRTILKLVVGKTGDDWDYDLYLDDRSSVSADKRLLFDLIAPYLADKSVLRASISLEFSPEAGQVFAVCYSDQASSFVYSGDTSGSTINIKDRTLQTREDSMLGYFGVDSLTAKIRGRGRSEDTYRLEIENGDSTNLILSTVTGNLELFADSNIKFTIYGSPTYNGTYEKVMDFTIKYSDIQSNSSINTLQAAAASPILVTANFNDGLYNNGEPRDFRIPVWVQKRGITDSIYIALDAADIQAQSITYAEMFGLLGGSSDDIKNAQNAFSNTYSFYRFGLPNVRFIRAHADIMKAELGGEADSGPVVNGSEEFKTHGDIAGSVRGTAVTFADRKEDGTDEAGDSKKEYIYGIENGRHFYNIRFESDYSDALKNADVIDKNIKRTFELRSNIDWNVFIGKSADEHNVIKNRFMNSYFTGNSEGGSIPKSGIDVVASDEVDELKYKDGDTVVVPGEETDAYPFSGFRVLSYGDTFKQAQDLSDLTAEDGSTKSYYKISNIRISMAANCIYGVYGKEIKSEIDDAIEDKSHSYDAIISAGKAGALPLGLFAENFGTIENVEIDKITVNGVEGYPVDSSAPAFMYTSKVGGFVGENFGTVKNLFIDEYLKNTGALDDSYLSSISGQSDVAGIVGHQYYKAVDKPEEGETTVDSEYKIEGCINNAQVTGVSYVGGIIGRIYPNGILLYDSSDSESVSFSNRFIETVASGNELFDKSKIKKFTIENCKNRGDISMNADFVKYTIDGNKLHRGFYFGGITGAAFSNENPDNASDFSGYDHNDNTVASVVIKNCNSCTLYSKESTDEVSIYSILNPANDAQKAETLRHLRATFVGGIVGGIRYGYIEDCSTTPDSDENSKYSFVFGDRYVGGIAGFSMETDYSNTSEFQAEELAKLDNGNAISTATGHEYNVINGTGTFGNYAIGGVAGCFGAPLSGSVSGYDFVQDTLENGYSGEDKYDYPVNCNGVNNSGHKIKGLLNTAIVLGYSFDSKINSITEPLSDTTVKAGRNFYGIGGITGLLATTIDEADFIQSESTKNLYMKLVSLNNASHSNMNVDSLKSKDFTVNILQNIIDNSEFVTDGVGGIAGHAFKNGNINKEDGTKYVSYIDAIVFGRNRIGGAVGDTTAYVEQDGCSSIANIIPTKISSSSGLFVLGKENVGGMVGVFSDNGGGSLNSNDDFDTEKKINKSFRVMGYRAVGGLIGTFYKYKGESGRETIYGILDMTAAEKINITGSMYVGGVVGFQEKYSAAVKNNKYVEPERYAITMQEFAVKADCFGGVIAGALYSGDNEYWPLDNLMAKGKAKTNGHDAYITHCTVDAKLAGAFVTGLYSYNDNNENNVSKSVLYNNTNNSNSVNLNYIVHDGESCNGLYNIKCIKDFEYDSSMSLKDFVLKENDSDIYDSIYKTFDKKQLSSKPDTIQSMNLQLLSQTIQSGSNTKHNVVVTEIYCGGLFGYVPKNTFVTVKNYRNRASLNTTGHIISKEAGDEDQSRYSYLGTVTGKVPVGMTVDNCWNSSSEEPKLKYYNSAQADYKGGITEVNAGVVRNNTTSAQTDIKSLNYYDNQNVGALVGVNGTSETDGINSGIITGGINDLADIKGHIVGGIAAVAGGSSTIEACGNTVSVTGCKHGGNEGVAGGILGGIMECLRNSDKKVVIKNCYNSGDVTTNEGNKQSAGIVYDSGNIIEIDTCRNYSSRPKYAITSSENNKKAKSIKYSLDASNITNNAYENIDNRTVQFGNVKNELPSENMYANFYIGNNPADNSPKMDTYKSDKFVALQYYSTVNLLESNNAFIDSVGFDEKNRIDEDVLGDSNTKNGKWKKENSNKKLTFEIIPTRDTGDSQNVYADVDVFRISWGNYAKTLGGNIASSTVSLAYWLMVYDVDGNYISTSAINTSFDSDDHNTTVDIAALENASFGNDDIATTVSGFISDGNVNVYKHGDFKSNLDKISKILIVVDDATFTTANADNNDSESNDSSETNSENTSENTQENTPDTSVDNNSGNNNATEDNGGSENGDEPEGGVDGDNAGTGDKIDEDDGIEPVDTDEVEDTVEDIINDVVLVDEAIKDEGEDAPDIEYVSLLSFAWKEGGEDSVSSMESVGIDKGLIENPFTGAENMKGLFGLLVSKKVSLTKLYYLDDTDMKVCFAKDEYLTGMTGPDFDGLDTKYVSFIQSMLDE